MRASSPVDHVPRRTRRNAAVVVADPHIVVVEGPEKSDPGALDDALNLFVKWAIRSLTHGESPSEDTPTANNVATYGPEN